MTQLNPELQLLESIYRASNDAEGTVVSQRQLARSAGLSVGLTNSLIRRFIERGWIKLLHVSGRRVYYALTPSGFEEIALRVRDYFARAERNTELYRKKIDAFVQGIEQKGFDSLVLIGLAELDFLFDYACLKHGISFYASLKVYIKENIETAENRETTRWATLVAVCADKLDDLEMQTIEEMKDHLGLPDTVPLIRFSQLLMEKKADTLL